MDGQKKPAGRPQIYQGWQPEQRSRRRPMPAQRSQEEKRKGEYRPLEVVEQQVTKRQKSETIQVPKEIEAIKEEQDVKQLPETEDKKVMQIPVQRPVKQSVQRPQQPMDQKQIRQSAQKPQQLIDQKPVRQSAQRPQQPIDQKPVRQSAQKPQQPKKQKPVHLPEQRMQQSEQNKIAVTAKRRRQQENDIKMHFLWMIFGLLAIALAAAIFYEIILGHGIKETGAERMEEQQQELMIDTEQNNIEILTPGGELVSEIKERENRRNLQPQTETEIEIDMQ